MADVEFRDVPLFADLTQTQLDQLTSLAHLRTYEEGDLIFREGEPGIGIFVVLSGTFEVRHDSGSADGPIEATLHAGQVFGLTSLLDDEPRRASAYAATDGELAVLTRMTFRRVLEENNLMALEVIRSMAKSLRAVTALL